MAKFFEYRALKIKDNGTDQDNNNPQVIIDHGPNVDHVNVQIYDQNGNPVLPRAPINVPTTDTTGGHGSTGLYRLREQISKMVTTVLSFTAYDNLGNILDRNVKYCFLTTPKKSSARARYSVINSNLLTQITSQLHRRLLCRAFFALWY